MDEGDFWEQQARDSDMADAHENGTKTMVTHRDVGKMIVLKGKTRHGKNRSSNNMVWNGQFNRLQTFKVNQQCSYVLRVRHSNLAIR